MEWKILLHSWVFGVMMIILVVYSCWNVLSAVAQVEEEYLCIPVIVAGDVVELLD